MSRKLTQEEFIRRATEIHKGKYSYENVVYKNISTKVEIVCPIHGVFEQTPSNCLQGKGCNKCAIKNRSKKRRRTREGFIVKSKLIWGNDAFDYSKVKYVNYNSKVTLICKKHNIEFEQSLGNHFKKHYSCKGCLMEKYGLHKRGYWTYERCVEVSKKYEFLSEFRLKEPKCYAILKK